MNSNYPSLSLLMKAAGHLQNASLALIEAQADIAAAHNKCGYIAEWPSYDRITRELDREVGKIRDLIRSGQFNIETEQVDRNGSREGFGYHA